MNTLTKIFFFAGGLLLAACARPTSTPDGYTLTGRINGLPDGTHVQLIPVSHDQEKPLADTIVSGGQFTFTGTVDEPRAVLLLVKDAYGSRRLMLENKAIEVSGTVSASRADGLLSYNLEQLAVSGSPLSARYDSLMDVRRRLDSLYTANAAAYANATDEERAAADQRFFQTVDSVYHATVMGQKETFWAPLLMLSLTTYLPDNMKSWYDALSEQAKNSYYGKMVKNELYPAGSVGSTLPDFTVKDKEGKDVTFASLCEGRKYVLIDFWASWCNPCRKEIPNLKKLYAQYASRGFQIVSISIDKERADWEKALAEEQLPWPNFLDETGVAGLYKLKFVPTMYLVDAQGVLVAENLRGEALAKKLAELLK